MYITWVLRGLLKKLWPINYFSPFSRDFAHEHKISCCAYHIHHFFLKWGPTQRKIIAKERDQKFPPRAEKLQFEAILAEFSNLKTTNFAQIVFDVSVTFLGQFSTLVKVKERNQWRLYKFCPVPNLFFQNSNCLIISKLIEDAIWWWYSLIKSCSGLKIKVFRLWNYVLSPTDQKLAIC